MTDFNNFQVGLTGAVYSIPTELGLIIINGPDQGTFLQRQTTNDVRELGLGRVLLTVLTSPSARILDVFYLLKKDDGIQLLTLPGHRQATFRYLKSRIFFNDNVSVQDLTPQVHLVDVSGPLADERLTRAGLERLPGPGEWLEGTLFGLKVTILKTAACLGQGYRLIFTAEAGGNLVDALQAAGVAHLSPDLQEILRVEAGLPQAGRELVEEFTPLETGLAEAVSSTKGCYTGQEVIARQITYDKVTQRLCGLRMPQMAAPGERLWAEGKPAGVITSVVLSPRLGPLALAVIRRPFDQPGVHLQVGKQESTESGYPTAQVVMLPFTSARAGLRI